MNKLLENKLRKLIRESIDISMKNKKDKEVFDYKTIISNLWREKIEEAKKFQRINFDLENDDSTKEIKELTFSVSGKEEPYGHKVYAELFGAGGDWEIPVLYFRVELKNSYKGNLSKDEYKKNPKYNWDISGKQFVLIPTLEGGNSLQKVDGEKFDYSAYYDSETPKEEAKELRITDKTKKDAWNWLKEYFEGAINDRD